MGNKSRAGAGGHWGWLGMSPGLASCAVLLVVGVVGHIALEGHSLVDACYATVGVMTTVGIVIVPTSAASRAFTTLLNLASLGVAAMLIGEIGESRKSSTRAMLRLGGKQLTQETEAMLLAAAAVPPLVGASTLFSYFEGWDFFTSLYFCTTSGTGLGMDGAVEPKTPPGRILFCVFVLVELGVICSLLNVLGIWIRGLVQGAFARLERGEGASGKDSSN